MKDFAVWWTTHEETNAIGASLPSWCPPYLHTEWASRLGRNGRARLWVSAELVGAPTRVYFDEAVPTAIETQILVSSAAGIVMRGADVGRLMHLPGLVTDVNLCRWDSRVTP